MISQLLAVVREKGNDNKDAEQKHSPGGENRGGAEAAS